MTDEFDEKAQELQGVRFLSAIAHLTAIADALRAEHTRGDAAGYIRGQIEALEAMLECFMSPELSASVRDRIAELRKALTTSNL